VSKFVSWLFLGRYVEVPKGVRLSNSNQKFRQAVIAVLEGLLHAKDGAAVGRLCIPSKEEAEGLSDVAVPSLFTLCQPSSELSSTGDGSIGVAGRRQFARCIQGLSVLVVFAQPAHGVELF